MGGDVPYPHGAVIRTCEEEEGGTSTTTAKYTTGIQFNNIKSHTINHELKFGSNNVAIATTAPQSSFFNKHVRLGGNANNKKKRREQENTACECQAKSSITQIRFSKLEYAR